MCQAAAAVSTLPLGGASAKLTQKKVIESCREEGKGGYTRIDEFETFIG